MEIVILCGECLSRAIRFECDNETRRIRSDGNPLIKVLGNTRKQMGENKNILARVERSQENTRILPEPNKLHIERCEQSLEEYKGSWGNFPRIDYCVFGTGKPDVWGWAPCTSYGNITFVFILPCD